MLMARPGVTYQDIANAACELKGQSRNVTIESVRSVLGTGSIGTINQHLRKWKEAQHGVQKIASKENLPENLIALVKGLWEGVVSESAEQFLPTEEAYKQEILELKNEFEKYKSNNQRWQKLFNQWQQEKLSLANEKLTLEQALEFAHKENQSLHGKHDGLRQQIQEKQERIDELHRLHQQTQRNLEHYRESAREQRLLDQQQFEHEKQQLQGELKNMREQVATQQHQCVEMQQKNQLLEQSYGELEKCQHQIVLDNDLMKDKIIQLEKSHIENQHMSQHWQQQCKEHERKLENKMSEWMTVQSENKILNQTLIDAKQLVCDTQDQNKLLASEKWELAQEKAQLEGQMKQMQKLLYAERV
jgi:hypothetical protein